MPTTISRKYAYADDLAIMHADGDWQAVERALTKDMATVGEYLQTWKLKLSTTKTVSAVFHLNNKEAKHELRGAAKNFVRERPATDVVRFQTLAILHKDLFDVTGQFLVYYNTI